MAYVSGRKPLNQMSNHTPIIPKNSRSNSRSSKHDIVNTGRHRAVDAGSTARDAAANHPDHIAQTLLGKEWSSNLNNNSGKNVHLVGGADTLFRPPDIAPVELTYAASRQPREPTSSRINRGTAGIEGATESYAPRIAPQDPEREVSDLIREGNNDEWLHPTYDNSYQDRIDVQISELPDSMRGNEVVTSGKTTNFRVDNSEVYYDLQPHNPEVTIGVNRDMQYREK